MLGSDDIGRVVGEVLASPARERLSMLCYRALSRQAAARGVGPIDVQTLDVVEASGFARAEADTALGNVLALLEQGPSKALDWALLAAFAIDGFAAVIAQARETERAALAQKLAAHQDHWLLSGSCRLQPFVDRLLDAATRQLFYDALAEAVLRDAQAPDATDPQARAVLAARLAVLHASSRPEAEDALRQIGRGAQDAFLRAQLYGLGISTVPGLVEAPGVMIAGHAASPPRAWHWSLLRWLSGWALLSWTLKLLAGALRIERSVEIELQREHLLVQRKTMLLGRTLRNAKEVHRLSELRSGSRSLRYPLLPLAIGVLSFCAGVLVGGLLLLDVVRAEQWQVLPTAAAFLFGGVALDLVLDVLAHGRRGRVRLWLRFDSGHSIAVAGLELAAVDGFLRALASRID
jgi:hypothetical protein